MTRKSSAEEYRAPNAARLTYQLESELKSPTASSRTVAQGKVLEKASHKEKKIEGINNAPAACHISSIKEALCCNALDTPLGCACKGEAQGVSLQGRLRMVVSVTSNTLFECKECANVQSLLVCRDATSGVHS